MSSANAPTGDDVSELGTVGDVLAAFKADVPEQGTAHWVAEGVSLAMAEQGVSDDVRAAVLRRALYRHADLTAALERRSDRAALLKALS